MTHLSSFLGAADREMASFSDSKGPKKEDPKGITKKMLELGTLINPRLALVTFVSMAHLAPQTLIHQAKNPSYWFVMCHHCIFYRQQGNKKTIHHFWSFCCRKQQPLGRPLQMVLPRRVQDRWGAAAFPFSWPFGLIKGTFHIIFYLY